MIEPVQFALHLQRQFARGRNDKRERLVRGPERVGAVEQGLRYGDAESHGFTGAGLSGDQKVALLCVGFKYGCLYRRCFFVLALS